jgi:hypothetical protein
VRSAEDLEKLVAMRVKKLLGSQPQNVEFVSGVASEIIDE